MVISESGKETTEIRCNTLGQPCKIKDGEASLWYNGDTLVVMVSLHGNSRVTKKRLKLSDDGRNLEVEIVRIAPAGATEKVKLSRQSRS